MTSEELIDIEVLWGAATPGPWTVRKAASPTASYDYEVVSEGHYPVCEVFEETDAEFIASSRLVIERLTQRVRKLERLLDALCGGTGHNEFRNDEKL